MWYHIILGYWYCVLPLSNNKYAFLWFAMSNQESSFICPYIQQDERDMGVCYQCSFHVCLHGLSWYTSFVNPRWILSKEKATTTFNNLMRICFVIRTYFRRYSIWNVVMAKSEKESKQCKFRMLKLLASITVSRYSEILRRYSDSVKSL